MHYLIVIVIAFALSMMGCEGKTGPAGPSGAQGAAMNRFMAEATPRQRELLGFPPPGDSLWTEEFIAGMATRYPEFDAEPYYAAK